MEKSQTKENLSPAKSPVHKLTREMIFLAEQAADSDLKILPSSEWALHHPVDEHTSK